MSELKIALLGLGTVGSGVAKSLEMNEARWLQHFGGKVSITGVLVRDLHKRRSVSVDPAILTTDFNQILQTPDLSVVIEVMGGIEPARTYILQALEKGCHVITANKELLAKHGEELQAVADRQGAQLLYEASVAGGIPIIGALREQLSFNNVERISGILNGTTNFILTKMAEEGREFEDVLAEAQQLGYAEQNPSSDVDGLDALYKLIILARTALGVSVSVEDIEAEGIRSVTPEELKLAQKLGYRIKLVCPLLQLPL